MTQGEGAAVEVAPQQKSQPGFRAGWLSDVGRVREINEDAIAALLTEFHQDSVRQSVGVFIVADGMGGHDLGEVASATAARTVMDELMRRVVAPAMLGNGANAPLQEAMEGSVLEAHRRLRNELPGSGTTLTAALAVEGLIAVGHVGDSRAYLLQGGEFAQITKDHSFVAHLVEIGEATPEEAAVDPRRNYLLRALGQIDTLEVDFRFEAFPPGSRLLICSDGLWGYIPPERLEQILREVDDPQSVCRELVAAANTAGGPDNISAVVVFCA